MSDSDLPTQPESGGSRREFLGQIAASAAVLAVAACTPPVVTGSGSAGGATAVTPAGEPLASRPPIAKWDDSWADQLKTVPHKAVFDAPDIANGMVVTNALVYMMSYQGVNGATDDQMRTVLVARHMGVPLAFNDALWARYQLGKRFNVKDPVTGTWAVRNPWARVDPADKSAMPGGSFTDLAKRGAILLACNFAANFFGGQLAKDSGESAEAVQGMIRANLVPGFQLAMSGIYATTRAQEAGCTFIRST